MHRLSESESDVAQPGPTLCDPVDCSQPCSSIHGIFQARILEWVAISFSRGSSQPRDWARVAHIVSRCFTVWATREVLAWIWKYRVWWGDPCVHLFFSTHSHVCPHPPAQVHPTSWQSTHLCFFPSPLSCASTALTSITVNISVAGFRILYKWNYTVYILLQRHLSTLFMIYVDLSILLRCFSVFAPFKLLSSNPYHNLFTHRWWTFGLLSVWGCYEWSCYAHPPVFLVYFWWHRVFVAAHGFSPVVVHGLLFAAASLPVTHGLQAGTGFSTRSVWLSSCDSWA